MATQPLGTSKQGVEMCGYSGLIIMCGATPQRSTQGNEEEENENINTFRRKT